MSSLRSFHIFFIVVVVAAADLFGIWCIWDYYHQRDQLILLLGLVVLLGGMAMIPYTLWFIRKLNRASIQ